MRQRTFALLSACSVGLVVATAVWVLNGCLGKLDRALNSNAGGNLVLITMEGEGPERLVWLNVPLQCGRQGAVSTRLDDEPLQVSWDLDCDGVTGRVVRNGDGELDQTRFERPDLGRYLSAHGWSGLRVLMRHPYGIEQALPP